MHPNAFLDFLERTLSSPESHFLWLQSISYLEFVGYRKMVKALPYELVEREVFNHLKDEIYHSFLLRESSAKNFPQLALPPVIMKKMTDVCESYFQSLDHQTENWVAKKMGEKNSFFCYLSVSHIIEKRAMQVYPQYAAALRSSPMKPLIQQIIRDESEHLLSLEKRMKPWSSLTNSFPFETEAVLFETYLGQMEELSTEWKKTL